MYIIWMDKSYGLHLHMWFVTTRTFMLVEEKCPIIRKSVLWCISRVLFTDGWCDWHGEVVSREMEWYLKRRKNYNHCNNHGDHGNPSWPFCHVFILPCMYIYCLRILLSIVTTSINYEWLWIIHLNYSGLACICLSGCAPGAYFIFMDNKCVNLHKIIALKTQFRSTYSLSSAVLYSGLKWSSVQHEKLTCFYINPNSQVSSLSSSGLPLKPCQTHLYKAGRAFRVGAIADMKVAESQTPCSDLWMQIMFHSLS